MLVAFFILFFYFEKLFMQSIHVVVALHAIHISNHELDRHSSKYNGGKLDSIFTEHGLFGFILVGTSL